MLQVRRASQVKQEHVHADEMLLVRGGGSISQPTGSSSNV